LKGFLQTEFQRRITKPKVLDKHSENQPEAYMLVMTSLFSYTFEFSSVLENFSWFRKRCVRSHNPC